MTPVEVAGVLPCRCRDHARVLLRDRGRRRYLQVRVHAAAGRAILASLNGVADFHGYGLDVATAALAALGARMESLTLASDGERLDARLTLRQGREAVAVDLEPCNALVAACRLRLPIFVEEFREAPAVEPPLPEPYRAFLAELDLSVLDGPELGGG